MLKFSKYHGTGNDFILIADFDYQFDTDNQTKIALLCNRRYGIGADGLMVLRPHNTVAFELLYFNANGLRGSLCGNGSRCAVLAAFSLGLFTGHKVVFKAFDGLHTAYYDKNTNLVSIEMKAVRGVIAMQEGWFIDTGSPHLLLAVQAIQQFDVDNQGKRYRFTKPFGNEGTNVNFFEQTEMGIFLRTYERGVEAETESCGTGNVALAVWLAQKEAIKVGDKKQYELMNKGGTLKVLVEHIEENLFMPTLIGPACFVFEGKINNECC